MSCALNSSHADVQRAHLFPPCNSSANTTSGNKFVIIDASMSLEEVVPFFNGRAKRENLCGVVQTVNGA